MLLCALVLGLACLTWLVVRGVLAQRRLNSARSAISELRDELGAGSTERVDARIAEIQRHSRRARELTSDPLWRVTSRLPYAGRTLRTGAGIARAVDVLAARALPDLHRASTELEPARLRPGGNRVDLRRLSAAEPSLASALSLLDAQLRYVDDLPRSLVLPRVFHARSELRGQLTDLRRSVAAGHDVAAIGPAMLGGSGRRRYLVMFLNNAEMRGSGGFFGAYGVLTVEDGRFDLSQVGPNEEVIAADQGGFVDLGPEYRDRYERLTRGFPWQNGNLSPHFPYAGQIWSTLWERTKRQRVDGVIALDPPALAEILKATGPARLPSGELVTGTNVVWLTESEAYARYSNDGAARGRYLTEVAQAVYAKLVAGSGSQQELLAALVRSAARRHVNVWSAHAAEQEVLSRYSVSGSLPVANESAFLMVTTQNAAENKMDYWIRREISWEQTSDDTAVIEVRLRNVAPTGLPSYVTGPPVLRPGETAAPVGRQRVYLSVFLSAGAGLLEAQLDGAPIAMESEVERGHPVYSLHAHVDPGQSAVLRLSVMDPGKDPLTLIEPPMVVPDLVRIRNPA